MTCARDNQPTCISAAELGHKLTVPGTHDKHGPASNTLKIMRAHTRSELNSFEATPPGNNSSPTRSQLKGLKGASALIQEGANLGDFRVPALSFRSQQQLPYKEPTEGISGSQRSHSKSHVDGSQGTTAPIQGANLRDFREPRSHSRSQLHGVQSTTAPIQGAMLMEVREQQLPYKEPT